MSDSTYCYPPDYTVLKNRLGIRDAVELDEIERQLVSQRIREDIPQGDFDLTHLKAIHRHLFQDVYEWAGDIRTIEISKGYQQFQPRKYILTGMADVHRRVVEGRYFQGSSAEKFAKKAAEIIGDINYVHPFREGNGRTQLQYLKLLAARAGHSMDLSRLKQDRWIQASREAHQGQYGLMAQCIEKTITER